MSGIPSKIFRLAKKHENMTHMRAKNCQSIKTKVELTQNLKIIR